MVKMATFDNPSYFTFSNGAVESNSSGSGSSGNNNKSGSKRLSGWVKFKRHFRSKLPATEKANKTHVQQPEAASVSAAAAATTITAPRGATAAGAASEGGGLSADDQFMKSDTFYYNFTAGPAVKEDPDDDVFVDATLPRSHKTVSRRRHSLGSWIRTSFSAVKRPATASTGSAAAEKPLLAGVSSTASTVTFRSVKDLRRSESGKADNQTPKAESRVRVSEEAAGEPRQAATETRPQLRSRGTLSQERRTASLDRRYTNSVEMAESSRAEQAVRSRSYAELHRLAEDDKVKQPGSRSLKVNRSRTVQDRPHRRPCCSRSHGNRHERRRASADAVTGALRRRCEKCRLKDQSNMDKSDVVIVFSKNCTVSAEWMHYFYNYMKTIFPEDQRSGVKVTPRDVENLVSRGNPCHDYMNQSVVDQEDQNRAETQQIWRTSVATATLQMVLVSRSLLDHVIKHANDPLGMLLDPKRVVALLLDVDETRDINEYHRAALFSYPHWIRVKMEDLDYNCVSQVIRHSYQILGKSKLVQIPRPLSTPSRFKLYPRKLGPGEKKATIVLLESGSMDKQVEILLSSKDVQSVPAQNVAWVNPYVISFRVPDLISASGDAVQVELRTDGISWGTRELKCANPSVDLSSLLNLIQNPLAIMCQLLNISPTDHSSLDRALEESLRKNLPLHKFAFFKVGTMELESSYTEIPTVLHFASRHGFHGFAGALLDCPGSAEAILLKNIHEMDCIQLAEKHGHASLADYLREFLDFTDMMNSLTSGNDDYDVPRPGGDLYSIPPTPRACPMDEVERRQRDPDLPARPDKTATYITLIPDVQPADTGTTLLSPQDELYEILKAFKDQQLSADEVESLANRWKERPDVQRDEQNRQAQLEQMRRELELRQRDRDEAKTASPMTMIKKILKPSKSDGKKVTPPSACAVAGGTSKSSLPSLTPPQSKRLYQNQSSHTSWSSDRSSVASALSCDSGAHSDSQEDKKQAKTLPEYEYPTRISTQLKMSFYLVPPPPRPVESLNKDFVIPEESAILMQPPRPPCRPPRSGIEILEEDRELLREWNLRRVSSNPYILPDEEPDWMENRPLPPRPRHSSPLREYVNLSEENRVTMYSSIHYEEDSPSSLYMRMESPRNLSDSSLSKSKWTHQYGDPVSTDEEVYITALSPDVPEPVLENPGPKTSSKPAVPRRRKIGLVQQTAVSADDIVLQSGGSPEILEQRSLDPANDFSVSEPNLSVQKLQGPDDRRPVPSQRDRNPKFSPTPTPRKLFPRPLPLIPDIKD